MNCFLGNYNENEPKCIKCDPKLKDKCIKFQATVLETVMRKLDSGTRQLLIGYQWTIGDALASNPTADSVRIIMLCEAFMFSFGITDQGKTGLMAGELYDKVQVIHDDLITYMHLINDVIPKCEDEIDFEALVESDLIELENRYSVWDNPTKVLRIIKSKFYSRDMYPRVIAQLTTVTSLNTDGYGGRFDAQNPPRFRNPQIDGKR